MRYINQRFIYLLTYFHTKWHLGASIRLATIGIFVQDIIDLGTVAASNNALLQLFGSRKIAKIATFWPLSPAPFIGTSPNFMRHTEFYQV